MSTVQAPPQTIWIDVSTSWKNRDGHMNGTLRTERNYACELQGLMPERLRLCRFQATRRRFAAVEILPDLRRPVRTAQREVLPRHRENKPKPHVGRQLEQIVRRWRRSTATAAFGAIDAICGGAQPFPAARAGDVLLLAGENWNGYDFATLRLLRNPGKMRIAAICQDLIPIKCPQFFEADGFLERFRRYLDFLIGQVDLVIVPSAQTAKDLADYAREHGGRYGETQRIELGHDIARGGETADIPDDLARMALEPGKFVLSVSTIQARKNFDLLYRLWRRCIEERLPDLPKLVLVGRAGFGSADLLWQLDHDPLVRDCIMVRHDISDAGLAWLYRNCAWTMYPSFYEGWGLPVSESLAYGKFCLASTAAALAEAGQGLSQHIDPLDFGRWHDAVVDLVRNPARLASREQDIKARYRPMTWRQSAEKLGAMLLRLCDKPADER